jgi:hypothetical protein
MFIPTVGFHLIEGKGILQCESRSEIHSVTRLDIIRLSSRHMYSTYVCTVIVPLLHLRRMQFDNILQLWHEMLYFQYSTIVTWTS